MNTEPFLEGSKVFDEELNHIGEGQIITIEDDLIEVMYPDIEEVITYTQKDANKFLHLLL